MGRRRMGRRRTEKALYMRGPRRRRTSRRTEVDKVEEDCEEKD